MKDRELRRLRRGELVELIYTYQVREQELVRENAELKEQLASRKLTIQNAGSIAEAALQLSGVFEAAQEAADRYVQSMADAQSKADVILAQARGQADQMLEEARKEVHDIRNQEDIQEEILREASRQAIRSVEENPSLWTKKHRETAGRYL